MFFIIAEVPSPPVILDTTFEPPNAIIKLNASAMNRIFTVNINDTRSSEAIGPTIYVNISDFPVGQNVSIGVSAMNRCGESSTSYTSVKIPVVKASHDGKNFHIHLVMFSPNTVDSGY